MSKNDAALLTTKKQNLGGKAAIHPEGTSLKKKENTKTTTKRDAENSRH